ncbi:PREDICTED: PC4 and SFRS1-interacting protein [Ceratosolen solmsi marchali]|uniref:PC4 and SFRS1-interacting protein n=1 Tax=Ceratosolen solmsi marchali TaxID=326594 RepID=A0AAJ7DTE2_9HYME|nr:PREDICTED: PC4 and SFRS1-interacting protein [Ceratosolen solmsi marchali]
MVKLPKRFSVGERIFAKVRGYPPWPAKIENITDPNTKHAKYHVVFYGTKEIGTCKIEDLFQYADNKDKFSKTVRRKNFHDGIQELEEDLKKNPNPVYGDTARDSEAAENVPVNVTEDNSGKESDSITSASGNQDGDAETGNLVIDESDKKKTVKRKSQQIIQSTPDMSEAKKKRGRKSMASVLAENTPKQDISHDSQDEDPEKKIVSRSGRKIKPKRFHDFSDTEISIDTSRNDHSIRSRTKIKSEESNENQETLITRIKKRMSIEKDDRKAPAKDEAEVENQQRLRTLRIESHIMFLDTQIRSSLGLDQANADECLEAMDQVLEIQLTPLMLKKHSHIVETIKRLRRYVGNLADWKLSEEETIAFKQKADKIKKKAELIYNKFKSLFDIPEGQTFWNIFLEQLDQFKQQTKDLTPEEIFSLLVDPTGKIAKPNEENNTNTVSSPKNDTSSDEVSNKNISVTESETK